ncbi:MAG: ABC transporter permease subunit [Cyclobacteriaceae bacterium]|nr:ABC transporter permease subunit [Cyclobacteriaceae bacterium]
MRSIWVITKRELASFFDSLIAYVMIVIFLGLSGFFTWLFGSNVFLIGQADLQVFFGISYWTLFFFIPAITMRTLAEENRSGTIELLSTKAVSDWQIVVGKFLACVLLLAIALACTIPYYITISMLGDVDHGAIIGGYFGLLLISSMYISIGIFASSLTNNQIVAFLVALIVGLFFHILFQLMASGSTGMIGSILDYLSARTHFESLSRGVIDTRDLIYFGSFILGGLVLSQTMLSKRNWHN